MNPIKNFEFLAVLFFPNSSISLDIRMSRLDIRMSRLDKRMSRLDIRMSVPTMLVLGEELFQSAIQIMQNKVLTQNFEN